MKIQPQSVCVRIEVSFRKWLFYPLLWFVAQPMIYMGADYDRVASALVRYSVRIKKAKP